MALARQPSQRRRFRLPPDRSLQRDPDRRRFQVARRHRRGAGAIAGPAGGVAVTVSYPGGASRGRCGSERIGRCHCSRQAYEIESIFEKRAGRFAGMREMSIAECERGDADRSAVDGYLARTLTDKIAAARGAEPAPVLRGLSGGRHRIGSAVARRRQRYLARAGAPADMREVAPSVSPKSGCRLCGRSGVRAHRPA
jgi:hypothetical protein